MDAAPGGRVPDPGGLIPRGGDGSLGVGRKARRLHVVGVPLKRLEALARGNLPQAGCCVVGCRDAPFAVRRDLEVLDELCVAPQDKGAPAGGRIPDPPDVSAVEVGDGHRGASVRAEGAGHDAVLEALEHADALAAADVPQAGDPRLGREEEVATVRDAVALDRGADRGGQRLREGPAGLHEAPAARPEAGRRPRAPGGRSG
mmetsp:Transcript_4353/g.10546  ORF Transcript_4353/g.10546 Transcript_4353/m.10546 type:complete len:202 (-) Transcript_4353:934-1539(-)